MITFWQPYKNISDEELMRLVQCREEKAFDELWQRYMPAMQNTGARRSRHHAVWAERCMPHVPDGRPIAHRR